jgi:AcrR family transcriptional regulator
MRHKKTFRLELDSVKLRGMVSCGLDSVKCHSINRFASSVGGWAGPSPSCFEQRSPMPPRPSSASAPPLKPGAREPATDLRQRILEISEQLLDTEGLSALSMREVARRSGVTHQAPYHHFGDREAILAELVTRGFDELTHRMAQANELLAVAGRREAAINSGLAYVGFAIDHPGLFRVMFSPELCDHSRFPAARQSGEASRAQLDQMVAGVHGPSAVETLAMVYWSQVHGLAGLIIDGPVSTHLPGNEARRGYARQVLEQFVDRMLSAPD